MESKNPFSFYDFLGYFVPGSIALFGIVAIYSISRQPVSVNEFLKRFAFFGKAELYFPLILLAYVAGHLLSYLSSETVERYAAWSVGYPSRYLLGLASDPFFSGSWREAGATWCAQGLTIILIAPIAVLDWVAGALGYRRLYYAQPLDPILQQIVRRKIARLGRDHAGEPDILAANGDIFRFIYHFALEYSKPHHAKMQNYVALFGLLRTLCFIAVLFFWGAVWLACRAALSTSLAWWLPLVFGALAYLLYADFMKFYRRFSLEAIMAATAILSSPHTPTASTDLQDSTT